MKSTVFAGRWVVAGLLFLSLLATGCPPPVTARPVWAYSREHLSYPAAQFLVAVGQGTTKAHALNNARDELRGQLKINFEQAVRIAKEKCVSGSWFDPFAQPPGLPPDLPQPVVAEEWSSADDENHHVMLAWEKNKLAAPLAEGLADADKAYRDAIEAGKQALHRGNQHYRALQSFLRALGLRAKSESRRAFVHASAPPGSASYPCTPSIRAVTDDIDRIVSGIRIQVVAGDGQRLGGEGGLAKSLTVAVRYLGPESPIPLSGMPVVFETGSGPGMKVVTGELGLASVDIDQVPGTAKKTIEARPDAQGILKDAGVTAGDELFCGFISRVAKPHASFRYLKASESRSRVLLIITESVAGAPSLDSIVASELSRELTKSGYDVLTHKDLPEAFSELTELNQLLAALKGHAELVIFGQLEAGVSQEVAANFVFSETSGKLELAVVASGQVVYSHDSPVKGAGLDALSSTTRAYSNLSRKVLPDIMSAVRKHLE